MHYLNEDFARDLPEGDVFRNLQGLEGKVYRHVKGQEDPAI